MARDQWEQDDRRGMQAEAEADCRSTKQHETRAWERTVFVPDGMQPVDIIRAYPFKIGLPRFKAGQISVNKRDVECIASAMLNPSLRWTNMGLFTVAPYEPSPHGLSQDAMPEYNFDPADYAGKPVLITGHHRFLALLLSQLPPAQLPPIQIRTGALAVSIYPWAAVEWGA